MHFGSYDSCRIGYHAIDIMTLYCKDDDPIALIKEPTSHQKFKPIKQRYTQLPRIKIHKDTKSRLHIGCGRPKSLSQPKIEASFDLKGLRYKTDWL